MPIARSGAMAVAGPSRLTTQLRRTVPSPAPASCSSSSLKRAVTTSTAHRKPMLATANGNISPPPPAAAAAIIQPGLPTASSALPVSTKHQRAKQRISELDSLLSAPSPFLRDRHQRQHTYLRISLTEKCNLRCLYCMPEDGVPLTPSAHLLSTDEIFRLAKLFVSQGVNKIRLTGGEPTIRPDLPQIISSLSSLKKNGLHQIGMTTNGIALGRSKLDRLVESGLTHLNVSLDTLDPWKFEFMTRRRGHEAVIRCIERALELGLQSVKINVVVIKGLNDTHDIVDFVKFTQDKPVTIRFIEYMPFDGNKWQVSKLVPYQDLISTIRSEFPTFQRIAAQDDPNDTSKHYQVPGFAGKVGFITSMTDNFCGTCNRIRVTADGNLKVCLFGNSEVSLRDAMRVGIASDLSEEGPIPSASSLPSTTGPATDDQLLHLIGRAVGRKHAKHAGMKDPSELAKSLNRPMITIVSPPLPSRGVGRQTATLRSHGTGLPSGSNGRSSLFRPKPVVAAFNTRALHSSAINPSRIKTEEKADEDDDDNPWGELDKAFENLQDERLYQKVYRSPLSPQQLQITDSSTPPSNKSLTSHGAQSSKQDDRNPITDMEEQIFALAGAASVPSSSSSSASAPFRSSFSEHGQIRFSNSPPSLHPSSASGTEFRPQKWSHYMQQGSDDGDAESPWSSLDAFVDHPENSAAFAVPIRSADSQPHQHPDSWPMSDQNVASHGQTPSSSLHDSGHPMTTDRNKTNSAGISLAEEEIFARAGAASVSQTNSGPLSSMDSSTSSMHSSAQEHSDRLTHVNPATNKASMVDVGSKPVTSRAATAVGRVYLPREAADLIRQTEQNTDSNGTRSNGVTGKGPVLQTAQLAGIMGSKRTSDLIPLCHPLALSHVDVSLSIVDMEDDPMDAQAVGLLEDGLTSFIEVRCTTRTSSQTGVEMESLTGCMTSCLTVWDMVKAIAGKRMVIGDIKVIAKSGGRSGDWVR